MALDVSELIDILGASQVDLVGYSMGTVVALIVASREPRVRRLVVGGIDESAVIQGGVDRRVLPREAIVEAMLAGTPGRSKTLRRKRCELSSTWWGLTVLHWRRRHACPTTRPLHSNPSQLRPWSS
jgi:pimeloyl-ACP methyl ester carboxylesterase